MSAVARDEATKLTNIFLYAQTKYVNIDAVIDDVQMVLVNYTNNLEVDDLLDKENLADFIDNDPSVIDELQNIFILLAPTWIQKFDHYFETWGEIDSIDLKLRDAVVNSVYNISQVQMQ